MTFGMWKAILQFGGANWIHTAQDRFQWKNKGATFVLQQWIRNKDYQWLHMMTILYLYEVLTNGNGCPSQ